MSAVQNNTIELVGKFCQEPGYSFTIGNTDMYNGTIRVVRLSGTADELPVVIPQTILPKINTDVMVRGEIRSRNVLEDGKSHLRLMVWAKSIAESRGPEGKNDVCLRGYLYKNPVYRKTPLNREITDLLLAVNRNNGKSDYIPCVAWEKTAELCRELPIGTALHVNGRFQSREYQKVLDNETVQKTAYELSLSRVAIQNIP